MSSSVLPSGQTVYDPRGEVQAAAKPLAKRVASLAAIRLGILDNTKWNSRRLLEKTAALLRQQEDAPEVRFYRKAGFSRSADPALIADIARENEAVITAIGD
jgi:hypothetical protein